MVTHCEFHRHCDTLCFMIQAGLLFYGYTWQEIIPNQLKTKTINKGGKAMKGKRLHRLVCLVLGILMMFSTLTTAFAGSSWAAPGGGVYGFGAPAGSSWVNSAQFLRVSLYWAPKASAGASGIGEDGADWSSPDELDIAAKEKG